MTKVIGITGGIGSGKSTASKVFEDAGIPCYNSDERAKLLYTTSETLKKQVIALFGEESYEMGKLNRKYIAAKVFENKALIEKLNALVHPLVANDFENWKAEQSSKWVVKEAAILIESGSYKTCDLVVLITAPVEMRVERVVLRDRSSREEVLKRMDNQLSDEEKVKFADVVFENLQKKELTQNIINWMSSKEITA